MSPTVSTSLFRRWASIGILLAAQVAVGDEDGPAVAPGAGARQPAASTLTVGAVELHRCDTGAPWCGYLTRPLGADTVSIYFEFYPHTGEGKATGTLVATEGGPGYPATESRDEYLELFRPLRSTRDVVLMDNRGTGRSGAVDCRPLQTDPALTEANIGRCGRSLGAKAGQYSSALAADDLAAILDALGSGPVDLYGDSYGTFFEQMFAVRHPDKLRSIILDGAYPLDGPDYAWYPNYAPAMREKFELACERSSGCSRLLGSSMEHMTPALEALRRAPVAVKARDSDGKLRSFTANATQLATVMFGSAPAYASVRETDAAARAFVAGDTAPLLRLMAETQASVDSRDETRSAARFSSGLAAAVMCQDAPQIFDMSLDPARRAAGRSDAIASRKRSAPDTYAPFTIDEYRGMPLDYAFLDQCGSWPALEVASMAKLRSAPYPDVPALVISGDLDNMTPVADGTLVAKHFPQGHQLVVPNGFHVNALAHSRSGCPADIARHFIETLQIGDTKCLASIPEVRVLPAFALRVYDLEPAHALEGNQASRGQLQIVTGALLTVGDAIGRMASNTTGKSVGLRGGTFEIAVAGDGKQLTLHDVRWTNDLRVSGTVVYPGRTGDGSADLTVAGPEGTTGTLKARWTEGVAKARAQVHGTFGKVPVAAEAGAP
jgi:pimeloyl-ACP methyl ester carboxylesterase